MAIAFFFAGHWMLSLFFQTFYLHRYAAHRMFTMSKGWERFFYLATYISQGSSFLTPKGYAILHRMHHAFSDTPKDPHSPRNHKGVLDMMWVTKKTYHDYAYGLVQAEPRFTGGYPEWRAVDRLGQSWLARIVWMSGYALFYVAFATSPWQYALVPIHWVMGPLHGGIVNWCGHRYGYRNFNSNDDSRNTLIFDFVTLGELFQNNHHKYGMSPNFAVRWFEIDPSYQVMRVLAWLKIIDFGERQQVARYSQAEAQAEAQVEAQPNA